MTERDALQLLVSAARYAVNRLESQGYSQVASDLNLALAIVESKTGVKADFSKYQP
jgi:hypothetical protein